jgi:hypothetical protein
MSQVTDSQTGKAVLNYHYFSNTDAYPGSGIVEIYTGTTSNGGNYEVNYPAGAYYEIRLRTSPIFTDNVLVNPPVDFYTWSSNKSMGPIERDVLEVYQGRAGYGSGGIRDWQGDGGPGVYLWGPWREVSKVMPGFNGPSYQHSYGMMTTTDGVSQMQFCGYIDNTLVSGISGTTNCSKWNFAAGQSPSGGDETAHLRIRDYLNLWFGGTYGLNTGQCQTYDSSGQCKAEGGQSDTDTYIEYIAVWTCAAWRSDSTCTANGITQ